ncbi:molybdate ABC transporter substrate-binding protein [Sporolactobacillus sp. THM7-4]|nr:molybdate ABC transporter substrate-binding protein [Sporolactobacillus sp. THM7-4]
MTSSGCSADRAGHQKSGGSREKMTLMLSAAASLQDALRTIQKHYQIKQNHVDLVLNFGGSGTLKQQIREGAPVDLFFSADENDFKELEDQGLIAKKKNLLGNQLVLIAPRGALPALHDMKSLKRPNVHRLAIGTPKSVPAGTYAGQTLKSLNLWNDIRQKIVYAKDVRQVLTYVETGNVDAGLVYRTDARQSNQVRIVQSIPDRTHDPIVYPVGILKTAKHKKAAGDFFSYLQSPEALHIFQKYGFAVPPRQAQ